MRAALALALALSACEDDAATPDLSTGGPLVARTMRVIATPIWVELYVADPISPSTCTYGHFAEPGTCVGNSDGQSCSMAPPGRCILHVALEQNGEELSAWKADLAHAHAGPYQVQVPTGSEPTHLAIRGCGGVDRVPIRVDGPRPTATLRRTADQHVHVAWNTDRPAHTAMVLNSAGEMCHTGAAEFEFATRFPAYAEAYVIAFDAPARASTIWGIVDVYTGGIDGGVVPP